MLFSFLKCDSIIIENDRGRECERKLPKDLRCLQTNEFNLFENIFVNRRHTSPAEAKGSKSEKKCEGWDHLRGKIPQRGVLETTLSLCIWWEISRLHW